MNTQQEQAIIDKMLDSAVDIKDVIAEFKLTENQIEEILFRNGYSCCPNCGLWVESGEMLHNPEDESDEACEACASGWGW